MKKYILTIFIILFTICHSTHGQVENNPFADFYVAIDGDDTWSGKIPKPNEQKTDGPFASIDRARLAIRQIKPTTYRDLFVLIRGGNYRLTETVCFTPDDSHYDGYKVIYMAYPGEEPVFSSDLSLTDWKKSGKITDLPAIAKGKIFETKLPSEIIDIKKQFYVLYDDCEQQTRSRSPGFEPTKHAKGGDGGGIDWKGLEQSDRTSLYFHPGALKKWINLSDIEIFIQPNAGYVTNYLPLQSVDEQNGIATTLLPATYPMGKIDKHLFACDGGSYRVENAIDYLDAPGEWVVNTTEKKIYYWPKDSKPNNVTIPVLTEYFYISGHEGESIVKNIAFRGLTFTRADRSVITKDDSGLQHEWDYWDKPNAMLRFSNTERCEVSNCRFTNSASSAIRFDRHSQENIVKNNLIDYIGGTGILFCGYGPGKKDVNKYNQIVNNQIHHCGEFYYQSPGIMIWQSGGNNIKNNKLHHLPYDAIVVSGARPMFFNMTTPNREIVGTLRYSEMFPGDYFSDEEGTFQIQEQWKRLIPYSYCRKNIIEDNEIFKVMLTLFDGNAIYLSDVGTDNIVRRNFIHHLNGSGMQQAIRTDAFIKETTITENVIYNCNGGGINVKYYENNVTNNIIAGINDIVYENSQNKTVRMFIGYMSIIEVYDKERMPPYAKLEIKRNIFYKTGSHNPFYREWPVDGKMVEYKLEQCDIDDNIYYDEPTNSKGQIYLKRYQNRGVDEHSMEEDPLFVNIKKGNFALKENSPAYKIGFKPIDMKCIGLTAEFSDSYKNIVMQQLGSLYDDFDSMEKQSSVMKANEIEESHVQIN